MNAHKSLPVRPGTPHRHESLLIFIQKPNRAFVRLGVGKRFSENTGNALRAPQIVKFKQGCASGPGQFDPPLCSFHSEARAALSMSKYISPEKGRDPPPSQDLGDQWRGEGKWKPRRSFAKIAL